MRERNSEKPLYFEEERARRKRRGRLGFVIGITAGISLVIYGAGWILFRSPVFRLQGIAVEGNRSVPEESVVDLLRLAAGREPLLKRALGLRNILAWPSKIGEKELSILPLLESLEIQKNYESRTITAVVKEREPYGIWCQKRSEGLGTSEEGLVKREGETKCLWFDAKGVAFKRSLAAGGNLIRTVSDFAQEPLGLLDTVLPPRMIPNLISVFEVLSGSELSVREVLLEDLVSEEVAVKTNDGPTIYFSLRFPASSTLEVIRALRERSDFGKFEYLDLRVENRVYYK